MKRLLAVLSLLASPVLAQVGPVPGGSGSIGSGTSLTACTSSILYADASSLLKCDPAAVVNGSVSTQTRSILTIKDTIAGDSATSNWFNLTGTFPTTLTATANAVNIQLTGAGSSSQLFRGFNLDIGAGYTGTSGSIAARFRNVMNSAGGVFSGVDGPGQIGLQAVSDGTGSNYNVGVLGYGNSSTAVGMGGVFIGNYGGLAAVYSTTGAYLLNTQNNAALSADNKSNAVPIAIFTDNSAIPGTTAATATIRIVDGAQMQLGNMVLTSSTMTPIVVAESRGVIHAYAWTNAMVTALGASTTGDINVATLPAKTLVRNAYVIIDTPDSSANALTVSCGDTGAGATNYIVASDAKAASNTVYGDVAAERGTAIDVEFYYIPSYTGTTTVSCRFTKTVTNLNTVTGSTGRVILETVLVP